MGILTNFLKLLKPEPNDFVDVVKHISENYDKLDQNAETTNKTLTDLGNNKLDKGTYPGKADDLNEEILKKLNISDSWRIRYKEIGNTTTITNILDSTIEDGWYTSRIIANKFVGLPIGASNSFNLLVTSIQENSDYKNFIFKNHTDNVMWINTYIDQKWSGWDKIMLESHCPFPVGALFETMSEENPKIYWPLTEWEKIEGYYFKSASKDQTAGTIIGSNEKSILKENLPVLSVGIQPFQLSLDLQMYQDYQGASLEGASCVAMKSDASAAGWSNYAIKGSSIQVSPVTYPLGDGVKLNIEPLAILVNKWKRIK